MLPRKRQKALVQKRWEMIRYEMYHNVSKLLIWNMGTIRDPSKTCHKFSDWFPNFQAVDSFILFDFILYHNYPQNLCMVAMDCSDCCVFCRYISIHQVFMSKTWVLNCNPFAKKYHINIKSFSAYLPTIFFLHLISQQHSSWMQCFPCAPGRTNKEVLYSSHDNGPQSKEFKTLHWALFCVPASVPM